MSTRTKLILGTVALVAALSATRLLVGPAPNAPVVVTHDEPELPVAVANERAAEVPSARDDAARAALAPNPAPPALRLANEPGAGSCRGRVIDLDGLPVPNVIVAAAGGTPPRDAAHAGLARVVEGSVRSDARGAFELHVVPPLRLAVRDERYATVFEGLVHDVAQDEPVVLVVAWRIALGGIVVDAAGNPVAGAFASIRAEGRPLSFPGDVLARSAAVASGTHSDARGTFSFSNAAELAGTELHVEAAGFLTATVPVPAGGDPNLRVVLQRSAPDGLVVAGLVELPDGAPAAGALVSAGALVVETDVEGRFVLELENDPQWLARERDAAFELVAVRAGSLPAALTLPPIEQLESSGVPEELVLRLGSAPLRIRGRVVDEQGAALAGVAVQALDATRLGLVRGPETGWFVTRTAEEVLGGGEVRTNARGEFELLGLLERDYTLEAMTLPSLLSAVTAPVAAGSTDVTIVLDRSSLGRVAGRIVDRAGRGIEGVRVSVSAMRPDRLEIGMNALTDEEGRFALLDVTTRPPFLRLEGTPIVPELFRELPAGADVAALELEVGRRCNLQVDWERWGERADELRIEDASGQPLALMILEGGGFAPIDSIRASAGLSPVVAVPDTAAHAVLLLVGEEVERVALHLVPGELFVLRR